MKRFSIFIIIALGLSSLMIAQERKINYIGTNPVSYLFGLSIDDDLKRFLPIFSGNEYGISLVSGYYLTPKTAVEGRLILGNIHQVAFVGQMHTGIIYHPFYKGEEQRSRGMFGGVFLKYWDYHNRLTKKDFHNVTPYLTAGYQAGKGPLIVDVRVGQTFAVLSWTDLEDTGPAISNFLSPWPEFIPVLPTVTMTISYEF